MQAFTRRIGWLLVAAGLVLCCLQDKSLAAEDNVFAGIAAEYHYRTKYKNMKGHKAFAIGPYGSYGYSWGWQNAKEAANDALKSCREDAVWWQKKYGVTGKCRLLAQGNKLLVSDPWIGPEWQKPSTGADIPLLKGYSSKYTGFPVKGVVLHVHGLTGLVGASIRKFGARISMRLVSVFSLQIVLLNLVQRLFATGRHRLGLESKTHY